MHDYSVQGFNKIKIIYWLAVISIIITPIISNFVFPFLQRISLKTGIAELATFSISGFFVFSSLWLLFSKFVWKLPFIKYLIKVPNIAGKWNCIGVGKKYNDNSISNDWKGVVIIEQSVEKLLVRIKSEKSTSQSVSVFGNLKKISESEYILTYMYENEPFVKEETLHRHSGFCRITFDIKNKTAIGNYYTDTDRKSYGTINLTKSKD